VRRGQDVVQIMGSGCPRPRALDDHTGKPIRDRQQRSAGGRIAYRSGTRQTPRPSTSSPSARKTRLRKLCQAITPRPEALSSKRFPQARYSLRASIRARGLPITAVNRPPPLQWTRVNPVHARFGNDAAPICLAGSCGGRESYEEQRPANPRRVKRFAGPVGLWHSRQEVGWSSVCGFRSAIPG